MASGTIQAIFNAIYPVGSIYMSVNNTSPATLFGGTWERIQDTFLLAAGSSYAAGATGGEAAVTLTVDQMPAHYHNLLGEFGATAASTFKPWETYTQLAGVNAGSKVPSGAAIEYAGGGQAHNNMPPYLAVYMWKRTA